MSSKSQSTGSRNISATRKSGLRTGSRDIGVAPVKVIVMPGYSAPAANDATTAEQKVPERPGAWFAEPMQEGPHCREWCVTRRNPLLQDGYLYESMAGADGELAIFTSRAEAHDAIRLAEAT